MKSYLPESHTDFIVAVFGEEFGAIGVLSLLAVYLLLCVGIVQITRQCRDRADVLLCQRTAPLIVMTIGNFVSSPSCRCPAVFAMARYRSGIAIRKTPQSEWR